MLWLNATAFLRDRLNGKISCFACAVIKDNGYDIDIALHEKLCELSDSEYECIRVRFDGYEYFE